MAQWDRLITFKGLSISTKAASSFKAGPSYVAEISNFGRCCWSFKYCCNIIDTSAMVSEEAQCDQYWCVGSLNSLMNNQMANGPAGIMSWRFWLHKFKMQRDCKVDLVAPQFNYVLLPKFHILVKPQGTAFFRGLFKRITQEPRSHEGYRSFFFASSSCMFSER